MGTSVEQALSQAKLISDEATYNIIKLPAHAITAAAGVIAEARDSFSALIVDQYEVSILINSELIQEFARRLPEHVIAETPYKLITFDVILDFDLVGFMAKISRTLADANISILTFAAYSRDHIMVPESQFALAMTTLENLQNEAKS